MTTLYDVPADDLIEAVADRLADDGDVEAPDWIEFTTTGVGRELPPEQNDFWATRTASLLRKIAVDGPVGIGALATEYGSTKGGSNRYQVRPPSQTDGSRKIIRTAVQQLEAADYLQTEGNDGRVVTADGRQLLDEVADEVLEDLDRPELERYA